MAAQKPEAAGTLFVPKRLRRNFWQSAANKFGQALIKKSRLRDLPLAQNLHAIFAHHKIDCVFDVGAHVGTYGTFLREEVRYSGLIVSVEPVRASFDALAKRAAADGNWRTENIALGAAEGTATINVMKRSNFSSFLQPETSAVSAFADENVVMRTEAVPVRRFDDLLAEIRRERAIRNIYLKLDTQGWDMAVIEGAGAALADVKALQSEVSVRAIYGAMSNYLETLSRLAALGFAPSGFYPVMRDAQLRAIEFDAVMVRSA